MPFYHFSSFLIAQAFAIFEITMGRKIKLIWDFFGDDAKPIAEHHVIHLKEFAENNNIPFFESQVESINENQNIAFITVDESNMITVRDALKPHRGQWAD
jgi:hypothetical protein